MYNLVEMNLLSGLLIELVMFDAYGRFDKSVMGLKTELNTLREKFNQPRPC